MTIKQLESTGELVAGIFGTAFVGAVITTIQTGQIPTTWPQIQHILGNAALVGAAAVFGWLKMKSPLQPGSSAPPKP
jgi:hypothetical protein